jgi:hypothetical protein
LKGTGGGDCRQSLTNKEIKNYANLDKNEKSSTCFYLKLLHIKVLQKFLYVLKGLEGTNQREN